MNTPRTKPVPCLQRQVRAQQAAQHIGDGHGQREVPPDVALEANSKQAARLVAVLSSLAEPRRSESRSPASARTKTRKNCRCRGRKIRHKTRAPPDAAGHRSLGVAAEARRMVAAQLLFGQRVGQHQQQHEGQRLAQILWRDHGHQPGAGQRAGKTDGGRRQQCGPAHVHPAAVLHGGYCRAPDRGALVGAKQRGRVGGGEDGKQRWHQNQPAAARRWSPQNRPAARPTTRINNSMAPIVASRSTPKSLSYS